MRPLLLVLFLATLAQSAPQVQTSHTTEALRGVSAVSRKIAWASGAHGTYLRKTDADPRWIPAQVPGAESLDFRAVVAFSADEAFLMSAGPGDQSRIYHTSDAGQHWQLQFTNTNPKGFFDSMAFWDPKHGIVLGDPIPDETSKDTGKLKFELLITDDGQTWHHIPAANLPTAEEGEGAFAASNTCIAILPTLNSRAVILSGDTRGAKRFARRSRRTPYSLPSPAASQGVFSTNGSLADTVFLSNIAVRSFPVSRPTPVIPSEARDPGFASTSDATRYTTLPSALTWKSGASAPREPAERDGASAPDPNIWFATGGKVARVFHSPDRGQTWQVFNTPITHGPDSAGIFSIAFRDATHGVIAGGDYKHPNQDGPNLAFTTDAGKTWTLSPIHPQAYFSAAAYDRKYKNKERILIVGQDFIFDFRPPSNPTRISPGHHSEIKFNAIAPYPDGGAIAVGPKGTIAILP